MSTKLTADTLKYMTVTGSSEQQARMMLSGVSELDFQAYSNSNLEQIDYAIRQEILILTAEAKKIADNFFAWQKECNADQTDRNKTTNLIARAALRGNSLSIVWQYQMKRKTPTAGKSTAISRVIQPASKLGYSEKQWKKLPDWIRDRVISTEEKFKQIRERYNRLVAIRSAVTSYKWAVKKDRGIKDFRMGTRSLPIPTLEK